MENTEILTSKIENEININNSKIKVEENSKNDDKHLMIATAVMFGAYLIALIFITKTLTVNSEPMFNIHNIAVNTNFIVYSTLSIPIAVVISLFELSCYRSYKKANKEIKALTESNGLLENELSNIKEHKKEFSKIKSRVDVYHKCFIKENKYLKLYKKGILNKKLQKKYTNEEIYYADEYMENHNKIKVKQV